SGPSLIRSISRKRSPNQFYIFALKKALNIKAFSFYWYYFGECSLFCLTPSFPIFTQCRAHQLLEDAVEVPLLVAYPVCDIINFHTGVQQHVLGIRNPVIG